MLDIIADPKGVDIAARKKERHHVGHVDGRVTAKTCRYEVPNKRPSEGNNADITGSAK